MSTSDPIVVAARATMDALSCKPTDDEVAARVVTAIAPLIQAHVEANLRVELANQIDAIADADDLLGHLIRMDTSMAEGARMALEVAAEMVRDGINV